MCGCHGWNNFKLINEMKTQGQDRQHHVPSKQLSKSPCPFAHIQLLAAPSLQSCRALDIPSSICRSQHTPWTSKHDALLSDKVHMGVSENNGTPKSWILIGFSIINHPFWGTSIFGNTHIRKSGCSLFGNHPTYWTPKHAPTRFRMDKNQHTNQSRIH